MANKPKDPDEVQITAVHPQVESPNSAVVDAAGNQTPGPPRVGYGVVGTVNGEGPFIAHVPAGVVGNAQADGYRGPGLHQIFAEAIREARRFGHHAPPAAHLAGRTVRVGEGINPEPTPSADGDQAQGG